MTEDNIVRNEAIKDGIVRNIKTLFQSGEDK